MVTPRRHHVVRWPAAGLALAGALQYVPSTVALGQWGSMEALPGGWCRWRGPATSKGVALTFDDGPDPATTPHVLDRLDELGLTATFFCLGQRVGRHGDLVAEIRSRGHQVASHGHRHEHHLARSPRWIVADLHEAQAAMAAASVPTSWYRPTYGQATGTTLWAARRQGWQTLLWSAWGREWATDDPAEVAARVGRGLLGGAVVLLHDTDASGRPGMWRVGLEALGPIAETLERRGLVAVTVDDLLSATA